ncbi:unnamed protein product [Ceutorhynchus assimilis]|uniref:Uncharacterized protein n=1 Tax=Ceutorhynchus assimilis TaxID=467358 RepID=A0A9P0DJT0_9CUCU|nr:unnamed protein product [Ceutorhynchus assimilis]
MSLQRDTILPSCSTRTRRIMVNYSTVFYPEKKIDELPLFPIVKYETSSFFTSKYESEKQKEMYLDRLQTFVSTAFPCEDYLESPVDDSDLDKDYEPSDSEYDDNIVESESRKRKVKRSQFGGKIATPEPIDTNEITSCSNDIPRIMEASGEVLKIDNAAPVNDKRSDNGERDEQNETEAGNLSNEDPELETPDLVNDNGQVQENEERERQNTRELKRPGRRLVGREKIERDKNKHPMRAICNGKCRSLCKSLTEEHRHDIWNQYWNLDYTSRRKWLSKHVTLLPVKRKNSTEIAVCRLTFLNTLGYTTDSVITELVAAIKSGPCGDQVKERRGGSHRPEADRDIIKNHIESFKPCVSHYRRKNAPNVRYLPRELTIKIMYDDFVSKHPNICKIEIYRQALKKMNISLRQPKSDVCEDCSSLKNILENGENEIIQNQYDSHRAKATKANLEYKKDSDEAAEAGSTNKRIYSMDLQKVIILPIMPQSKTAFFTSRLVVFNQTFATLSKESSNQSYCVLWHEALGGRKAEALVDAMFKVIEKERDATDFIFWADNYSAQNKNWVLYTSLVTEVNRVTGPNQITIRYLTKGHTHMSADGIHGNSEQKLLRKRNIYDFQELIEAVESSRRKLEVLQLKEFHLWPNKKRNTKKAADPLKGFLLNEIVDVCFKKGSQCMQYKKDFADEYIELDFIQKKHNPMTFTPQALSSRGISASKKAKILKDLVPLMPTNRRVFWETMPESKISVDLVDA